MRMRVAACFAMLTAVPAAALEPMPIYCPPPDVMGEGVLGYYPNPHGPDFVSFRAERRDASGAVLVLEYCPTRLQLVLDLPLSGDPVVQAAAEAMLNEMIWGPAPFTQQDMAARLRAIGAEVDLATVDYQSCACRMAAAN